MSRFAVSQNIKIKNISKKFCWNEILLYICRNSLFAGKLENNRNNFNMENSISNNEQSGNSSEKLRMILKENLTGTDITKISLGLDCSVSKITKCLNGSYGKKEMDAILYFALSYFCSKYLNLINELKSIKGDC